MAESCVAACVPFSLLKIRSKVFKRTFVFGAEDAIIRGVLFVPLFTKFLTQMHRDALSADPVPRQQHVLKQFAVGRFTGSLRPPSRSSSVPSPWSRLAQLPSPCSFCTLVHLGPRSSHFLSMLILNKCIRAVLCCRHGPIGQIFYKKVRPSTGHSWLCIDR